MSIFFLECEVQVSHGKNQREKKIVEKYGENFYFLIFSTYFY